MFEHMPRIPTTSLLQLVAASNVLVITVIFRATFDTLFISCILFPLKGQAVTFSQQDFNTLNERVQSQPTTRRPQ